MTFGLRSPSRVSRVSCHWRRAISDQVAGANAYFFRRVFHDYSDELCAKALNQVISAMAPDSRILIADMLLPQIMSSTEAHTAALDVACMVMGGKERTEEDFKKLFDGVGLEVVKVHRAAGAAAGIVEGKLKTGGEVNSANGTNGL